MKNWYLLLMLVSFGCDWKNERKVSLEDSYWVSNRFDLYETDSATGIKPIYGSGKLLYFTKGNEARTLIRDFYWKNDSLFWGGEPGFIQRTGSYQIHNGKIVLDQKLVEKTFLLPYESIGMAIKDSLQLIGDRRLVTKNDTLEQVTRVSKELKKLIEQEW
jgi:hypothetical protein